MNLTILLKETIGGRFITVSPSFPAGHQQVYQFELVVLLTSWGSKPYKTIV